MQFASSSSKMAALVVASFLAGCGGGGGGALPSGTVQAVGHERGTVRITIAVPKATATASARRMPRYVSPATASMTVNIVTDPGGASVVSETVSLTTTSSGCSSTLASTLCTLSISLAPGSYDASISTADAGATVLSQGQLVDFTIAEGQTNTVALTLSGIPVSLSVSSSALAVHGSLSAGFTLYGLVAQPLVVEALDADGNVIVGPGSPTFTVASVSGSGFTIANPTTTTPNTATLTPPGTNGTAEVFSLTAAYGDGTCSLSGAMCSATFSVKNDVQTLLLASETNNKVLAYAPPYTGTPTSITNGVYQPATLAMDRAGDLFVTGRSAGVTEYAPPYTAAPSATVTSGIDQATALALDAASDLFVASYAGNTGNTGAVTEYAVPYTAAPAVTITAGVAQPTALALDSSGNLFVMNFYTNTVTEYAPPYTQTSPTTTISTGIDWPDAMALNAAGDLFVANYIKNTVTEYAPPYTGAPTTISAGVSIPDALAINGAGDLFVANSTSITEYAPPYTGSPVATISDYDTATAMAFDGMGDLFAVNATNDVFEFAPNAGSPMATISSGQDNPMGVLLTP
jgi:hypothetical protein